MTDTDKLRDEAVEMAARALWATKTSELWDERLLVFPDSQDIAKARADASAILSASGLFAEVARLRSVIADTQARARQEIEDAKAGEAYCGETDNGAGLMSEQSRRFAWETVVHLLAAGPVPSHGETQ